MKIDKCYKSGLFSSQNTSGLGAPGNTGPYMRCQRIKESTQKEQVESGHLRAEPRPSPQGIQVCQLVLGRCF